MTRPYLLLLPEKIAIELREMWQRQLGIKVELRQLEWKTHLRAQFMLDYDLIRSSWIGDYYDPRKITGIYGNLRAEHPLRAIQKVRGLSQ